MFCERNTKLAEIETFLLRAFLNKEGKIFILANLQNLPLILQHECLQLHEKLKRG